MRNTVDASYRLELREANFARFEPWLREELATLRADLINPYRWP